MDFHELEVDEDDGLLLACGLTPLTRPLQPPSPAAASTQPRENSSRTTATATAGRLRDIGNTANSFPRPAKWPAHQLERETVQRPVQPAPGRNPPHSVPLSSLREESARSQATGSSSLIGKAHPYQRESSQTFSQPLRYGLSHGAAPPNAAERPVGAATAPLLPLVATDPTGGVEPQARLARILPGPAGRLQKAMDAGVQVTGLDDVMGGSSGSRPNVDGSGTGDADFLSDAWLAALSALDLEEFDATSPLLQYNAASVKRQKSGGKIPQIVLLVVSMKANSPGNVLAKLKDPTGIISAAIHEKVLQAEPDISPGAVLMLTKVSFVVPMPRTHYLCITLNNVLQVLPADICSELPFNKPSAAPLRLPPPEVAAAADRGDARERLVESGSAPMGGPIADGISLVPPQRGLEEAAGVPVGATSPLDRSGDECDYTMLEDLPEWGADTVVVEPGAVLGMRAQQEDGSQGEEEMRKERLAEGAMRDGREVEAQAGRMGASWSDLHGVSVAEGQNLARQPFHRGCHWAGDPTAGVSACPTLNHPAAFDHAGVSLVRSFTTAQPAPGREHTVGVLAGNAPIDGPPSQHAPTVGVCEWQSSSSQRGASVGTVERNFGLPSSCAISREGGEEDMDLAELMEGMGEEGEEEREVATAGVRGIDGVGVSSMAWSPGKWNAGSDGGDDEEECDAPDWDL